MVLGNSINTNLISFASQTINFKNTGATTIFTVPAGLKFLPYYVFIICDSATAANGDGTYNLGFTAASYNDYLSIETIGITTANTYFFQDTIASRTVAVTPASTALRINVVTADTGTALTGRVIVAGILIS